MHTVSASISTAPSLRLPRCSQHKEWTDTHSSSCTPAGRISAITILESGLTKLAILSGLALRTFLFNSKYRAIWYTKPLVSSLFRCRIQSPSRITSRNCCLALRSSLTCAETTHIVHIASSMVHTNTQEHIWMQNFTEPTQQRSGSLMRPRELAMGSSASGPRKWQANLLVSSHLDLSLICNISNTCSAWVGGPREYAGTEYCHACMHCRFVSL